MFALHAQWRADRRLALWAEHTPPRTAAGTGPPAAGDVRATEPAPRSRPRAATGRDADAGNPSERLVGGDVRATEPASSGRPPKVTGRDAAGETPAVAPATHPFAVPAAEVVRLLSTGGPGLGWLAGRAAHGTAGLMLPTTAGRPRPSPELRTPAAPGDGRDALAPWTVPAVLFTPGQAAQLLGELSHAGLPELPYGASVRWLVAAHDLAWRLVGRGRLLPELVREDGVPHARWRPAPDAAGHQELARLTAAVPPTLTLGAADGVRSAAGLVTDVMAVLVDSEARAALEDAGSLVKGGKAAGAAEAWAAALGAADGRMRAADPVETARLGERLAAWHASAAADDQPLRLCFRLTEPRGGDLGAGPGDGAEDDGWSLDFLVQAVDEPSLTVEAAEVWTRGPAQAALTRYADDPPQTVLAALTRAARTYQALRTALAGERPSGLRLDRAGALAFLREAAPALTEAGFGVLVPSWWQRKPALGMALTVREPQPGTVETSSIADRDAIVAFRWRVALGDQALTDKELTALAAARQPLVRLRGQWTEVDPERIAAVLAFLERAGSGTMTTGQALRIALDPTAAEAGLPVTAVTADAPADRLSGLGALLRGSAEHRPEPVAVPADFTATLRPYQQRGLDWLAFLSRLGLGAVLADDMGLGKTAQTLALLATERDREGDRDRDLDGDPDGDPDRREQGAYGPTLVVCPMSLVGNWRRETAAFAPKLRVYVHHGAGRLTGTELAAAVRGADLVITTYGLVQRDHEALAAVTWRRLVVDEAQSVKNSATHQYRALRALPARHRIALTGTPVENRLAELHALLDLVNPGLFGTAGAFKERYAIPVERDGDAAVAAELRRRTAPFVLRRLKSDPAIARELPAKQHIKVVCNLTAEQAALYRAVVADMLARMDETRGLRRRAHVLAALGKLKQVCNHPAHFLGDGSSLDGRSGKLARLEETLETALAAGDKALCFTQYAAFGALLRPHLARRLGTEVLFLHGGDPARAREEMVARFQEADGPAVFLLSLKAGGTGLNLTAASQVVHIDRWWNPAVEDQATDRAFRIGQPRDVQVRTFVCAGTVEERVDAMIEAKRTLADAAVGAVGAGDTAAANWLAELTTAELRDALRLSEEEAVSE
ncbi:SNF2-related protein [Streptomyces sp. NPDC008139]|uniref:SNF2-related protein n=1 Tax=Streptomyces sp. NPDC008139 TaxID=3364814 RepID=UPI0036EB8B35